MVRPSDQFAGYRWETEETNDLVPYSHHPYAYALGDPVRYTDPTGKCVTGVVIDTVICGGLLLAGTMLVTGGVIANDPAAREAAEDVARRSTQAIQNITTDASRGARYIASGNWLPPGQEFFPLLPQEGRAVRLGPNLEDFCATWPEGFSVEQLDPNWWLRQGPTLDGEQSRLHTGSPMVGEPPTVVFASRDGTIDPYKVRFSQRRVSWRFKDGGTIGELAEDLRDGSVRPDAIPPIRLVNKDGVLYTLDNRRLEAFRRAGIDVPYRMATQAEINAEQWKFDPDAPGTTVRVRGEPK